MFKIKYGYKLDLQTSDNIKLFGSTKILNKKKTGENIPSIEVVEVALIQRNLLNNLYQQKFYSQ